MSAIAQMIEDAEARGGMAGDILVIFDGEGPTSVLATVGFDGRLFRGDVSDHAGRGMIAYAGSRVDALQRAFDGYLDILNNGI